MKIQKVKCIGGCGKTLEYSWNEPKDWYGKFKWDNQLVAGICKECYKREKEKNVDFHPFT